MKYGFGVDLGGTTVKLAYFDQKGTLLHKWEIPTDTSDNGKHILSDIASSIRQFLNEKNIPDSDILGIGIGVPGPVDDHGRVNGCVNLGWGMLDIERELSACAGFPVKAGNDASVAALGEYWKGGGKGFQNMIFITLGTGVGGGIIIGGNVLHGVHGAGGEIGHVVLNRDESLQCNCGNHGCAEQYCSATGIVRLAKAHLAASGSSSPLAQCDPLTAKDVFDAAAAADPDALQILDTVYGYLGHLAANLCSILDPEVVVLGGGVSKAGQPLLDGLHPHFQKYVFHGAKDVKFKLAELGNDAGAYGAFKLVLSAFGND